jgi:hypothetical protein
VFCPHCPPDRRWRLIRRVTIKNRDVSCCGVVCRSCAVARRAPTPGQSAAPRRRPADNPTSAFPGSAEKVLVMRIRYETGQELFHPGDLTVRLTGLIDLLCQMGRGEID